MRTLGEFPQLSVAALQGHVLQFARQTVLAPVLQDWHRTSGGDVGGDGRLAGNGIVHRDRGERDKLGRYGG